MSRGFQPSRKIRERSTPTGLAELQQLVQHHAAGQLTDPLSAYRDLQDRGVQHPVLAFNLAQLEFAAGELERADHCLDQTLKMQSDLAVAWALRGTIKRRLGEIQAALECLQRALELDEHQFPAWLTLSVLFHDQGSYLEAIKASTRALDLQSDSAAAHANHSMILLALGQSSEAEHHARLSVQNDAELPEAFLNLGNALHAQERWDDAIQALQEAIRLRPLFAPALSSLGNALRAKDQLLEAEEMFRRSMEAEPSYFQAYSNLAITQRALGQLDQALDTALKALELAPDHADVHSNLGVICHERGEWGEAEAALRRSLELAPDHAESHFSLASILLQQGDYEQGWLEYEWRFTHNARHPIVREVSDRPRWLGPQQQSHVQQIVLLHEQGLGDSFQFIRFAPLLSAYAKSVVFTCPKPLMALFASSGLVDEVLPIDVDSEQLSRDAVWLPLMSLPAVLGLSESSFGEAIPYLPVDGERVKFWRKKLDSCCCLIALNWQGNPEHEKTTSRGRSIPLEAFAPLAMLPGVRFISLQKGYGSEQLATCSFKEQFVSCQDEIDAAWDFEDAAALMACSDLVISSDTSAAHLAGAVGARLWMPLKRVPEWRWGTGGSTSPWYPTATLFRQERDGDWSVPVQAMRQDLELEILAASERAS
ncbi:tetratricopeptide repeat protein [Synechococcus sp. CB0101]|uniref:tetratricopeptide repeat protein n=1 Tax=Synechococcus sp. CB0101 TaxID=232348 RepID=UPI0002D91561|nr:tetratricopeptide repeat protein [Synechococcus sp. CB0101]